MIDYKPSNAWQRATLGLLSGVTALAVLASGLVIFSDRDDRVWIAAALGIGTLLGGTDGCRASPFEGRCVTRVARAAAPLPAPASAPTELR